MLDGCAVCAWRRPSLGLLRVAALIGQWVQATVDETDTPDVPTALSGAAPNGQAAATRPKIVAVGSTVVTFRGLLLGVAAPF